MFLTFEGSPHRQVGQGKGVSHQEGPQGERLVQFTQRRAQTGLTAQTPSAELQPVVHLQAPHSVFNRLLHISHSSEYKQPSVYYVN